MKIDVIDKTDWVKHYRNVWYNKNEAQPETREIISSDVDLITIIEIQEALKEFKNRKATGTDNLNAELLKYGGMMLYWRLQHIVNYCWQTNKIPD